eukprot:CAMPEP_0184504116 /NCGR_PEP_ID=MMETSP0113_2-20130426/52290_1 /TAXON_ID=91329 /ORGANISM="Norrisiella sphaerica, Strain BC52" /LENGTH=376 /DNA_ID=CAMNT_0026893733 /DNA_START=3 /DNA_END=1133 /DNA_ORIENTATION=+
MANPGLALDCKSHGSMPENIERNLLSKPPQVKGLASPSRQRAQRNNAGLCRSFQRGHCGFGDGCKFIHSAPSNHENAPFADRAPSTGVLEFPLIPALDAMQGRRWMQEVLLKVHRRVEAMLPHKSHEDPLKLRRAICCPAATEEKVKIRMITVRGVLTLDDSTMATMVTLKPGIDLVKDFGGNSKDLDGAGSGFAEEPGVVTQGSVMAGIDLVKDDDWRSNGQQNIISQNANPGCTFGGNSKDLDGAGSGFAEEPGVVTQGSVMDTKTFKDDVNGHVSADMVAVNDFPDARCKVRASGISDCPLADTGAQASAVNSKCKKELLAMSDVESQEADVRMQGALPSDGKAVECITCTLELQREDGKQSLFQFNALVSDA